MDATAAFSLGLIGAYPPELRDQVNLSGATVLTALQPWSTGETQINFQRDAATESDVCRAWPEPTWERLQELKRKLDPEGRSSFGFPI